MEEIRIRAGERKEVFWINPKTDVRVRFIQEANSLLCVNWVQLEASGQSFDHHVEIEQVGEDAETDIYGLACLSGEAHTAFRSSITHAVPHGKSNQLFKYVLKDKARGMYDGRVTINTGAQKTEVKQTNKNILLTPSAVMESKPQLEIYADDVKASHGASCGQLDHNVVFYMKQRGIDSQTIYSLLIRAFINEVTEHIQNETQQNEINRRIEEFLSAF